MKWFLLATEVVLLLTSLLSILKIKQLITLKKWKFFLISTELFELFIAIFGLLNWLLVYKLQIIDFYSFNPFFLLFPVVNYIYLQNMVLDSSFKTYLKPLIVVNILILSEICVVTGFITFNISANKFAYFFNVDAVLNIVLILLYFYFIRKMNRKQFNKVPTLQGELHLYKVNFGFIFLFLFLTKIFSNSKFDLILGIIFYSCFLFLNIQKFKFLKNNRQNSSILFAEKKSNISKKSKTDNIDELIKALFLEEETYLVDKLNLDYISFKIQLSPKIIKEHIQKKYNQKPKEFIENNKIKRAKYLLFKTEYSIHDIMLISGFKSKVTFIRQFKKHTNYTPSEYSELLKTRNIEYNDN